MTDDDELRHAGGWPLARELLARMRPAAHLYGFALITAWVAAELTVYQPLLLKLAIDEHVQPRQLDGLAGVALTYLFVTLASFGAEALYTLAAAHAAMNTITRLRRDVVQHTLAMAQAFFDRRPTGRILTRATSDIEALGETLTAGAYTIVLDAIVVVRILVAMALLDVKLTLLTLLLAPVIAFAVDRIRRILRDLFVRVRGSVAVLNAFTAERLAGAEVVQLYSDEARAVRMHDELLGRYRDANVRTNVWDALLYAIMDGLTSIAIAMLIWYGSGGLLEGAASAGLIAAFIQYVDRLMRPIQEFSAKVAILQRAQASLEKVFGLLSHHERITPGDMALARVDGAIRLRDVQFAYGEGPPVLAGVSFDVMPGQVVAIVGRTGSGKSTIAKLLTRTYDGYRGSIILDGIELSRLAPADVRAAIAMVRQDVQLFPGDVRFNLTLGRPIDDERLIQAIHTVQAEAVIDKLGGLGGHIQHHAANLSVGEAQLLGFARVMAHDAPVVVLDEATASVDTLTEARIQAATDALFRTKTVIVIAHRLSTVVHSDRIVVMDHGRVVETGTHEELLARGGAWTALFQQQFEAPRHSAQAKFREA